MPDSTPHAAAPSFAEFVQSAPSMDEAAATVVLTGAVLRSANEGKFVMIAEGFGPLELDIDAITAFDILEDSATRKWGRVVIGQDRITKPLLKDIQGDTLAFKDVAKDPITDPVVKQVAVDPPNTLVENVGDPRQAGIDSVVLAGGIARQAGAMPFVMATPHHAPEQALQMQAAAAGVPGLKAPITDLTSGGKLQGKDISTDPIVDVKNLPKDVHTDPIVDVKAVSKDVIADPGTGLADTLVEGGGTIAEGGGTLAEGGFGGQGGFGPAGNPGV